MWLFLLSAVDYGMCPAYTNTTGLEMVPVSSVQQFFTPAMVTTAFCLAPYMSQCVAYAIAPIKSKFYDLAANYLWQEKTIKPPVISPARIPEKTTRLPGGKGRKGRAKKYRNSTL